LHPAPAPVQVRQVCLRPTNDDQGESARVRVGKLVHAVLVPSALGAVVRVVAVGTNLRKALEQRVDARRGDAVRLRGGGEEEDVGGGVALSF